MAKGLLDNDLIKIGLVAVVVWVIATGGIGGGTGGGDEPGEDPNCGVAPTVSLSQENKYDSTKDIGSAPDYILDGAGSATYSAAFTAGYGDTVSILYGNDNASYTNEIGSYTVSTCGLNIVPTKKLVENTSITIQCFNEEGNPIDDSGENETIGTGEAPTLRCELRGASEKGHPLGYVMVGEVLKSTMKENDVAITSSDITISSIGVPSAYTLSSANNKDFAYDVGALEGAVVKNFYIYLPAEDDQNPGTTSDVTLNLYAKDCFENSESGAFECGIEDENDAFVGPIVGAETIHVD